LIGRFYVSLRNTALPMLFLFELSCILPEKDFNIRLHTGVLLLFMVRDYFFLAESIFFYFNIFIVW